MKTDDAFFPALADQAVTNLRAAQGDERAERAAMQKLVDAYTAGFNEHQVESVTGEPMIPERFCEDSYKDGLSVIEYAAQGDEDAEFRWRELLCDLCGY